MDRRYRSRQTSRRRRNNNKKFILAIAAVVLIIAALVWLLPGGEDEPEPSETPSEPVISQEPAPIVAAHTSALPSLFGVTWEMSEAGQTLANYSANISFSEGSEYTALDGIITFRGNNYRDTASFGTASVTEKQLSDMLYKVSTGSVTKSGGSGSWSGSGWTGQPLIVKWPEATKQAMNLYDAKKQKQDLVEVIYATLDGNIYFLDLDDGSYTRDPIKVGFCFKGSGSLDPRGYPLLYIGSGDPSSKGEPTRAYIFSLIDGSCLYTFGIQDPYSLRQDNEKWNAYDSSALVDADTDTLIYPGENGIIYTIKLNSRFDAALGTVSVAPAEPVKWRYNTSRSSADKYWYGIEASAAMYKNYMYFSENGGLFMCLDLNTMDVKWVQDTKDDSNSSPLFEETDNGCFIYTAPSLHWTKDENSHGTVAIYKLNALTGEIIWEKPYEVYTVSGVSGGVQDTGVLGKNSISDLVIYAVARTPSSGAGKLVALDKNTGNEVWCFNMDNYAWSSPVAVYDASGNAYIVQCDSAGNIFLLDGKTGQMLDKVNAGSNIEASPAVYGNTIVVGTRGQKIIGLKIK